MPRTPHRQRLIRGIHAEAQIPGNRASHLLDAHRVVHIAAGATRHGNQQRHVRIAVVDAAVLRTDARVAEVVAGLSVRIRSPSRGESSAERTRIVLTLERLEYNVPLDEAAFTVEALRP